MSSLVEADDGIFHHRLFLVDGGMSSFEKSVASWRDDSTYKWSAVIQL